MPPKLGAIALQTATISSTSFVARQSGQASTPPNSLKSTALPSITGIAASGPMSPRPSTAVPSETTATVFCLIVRFQARSRSSAIALQIAGDARRVGHREVVARLERASSAPPRSCRRGAGGTCGRRRARPRRPSTARTASTIPSRCSSLDASTVTSRTFSCRSTRTRSIAPSEPPASPIAFATRANEPGASERRTRDRRAVGGGDVAHAVITPPAASAAISSSS